MISIVVLTYNSLKYIQACLDSICSQDFNDIEIIVIDNGSNDGTGGFIKANYSQIKVIENGSNLGSCKARNHGIGISNGEWILTLDSDVVLAKDFFKEFVLAEKEFTKDIGMAQPEVLNSDARTVYSRGIYLSFLKRFYDYGRNKPKTICLNKLEKIIGPCCAAAFYRRSMLEQIKETTGYFDERFFFLVEDVDLAWRASLAMWRMAYLSKMTCYHSGNSSATNFNLRQYLCFRNRYLMINKNAKILEKARLYSLSFIYEILRYLYLISTNRYFWCRPKFFKR